jgi:hypothetical protein
MADPPPWDRPWWWFGFALAVSAGIGWFLSGPHVMSFVVTAQTRSVALEWPCADQTINWTLPSGRTQPVRYRTAGMTSYLPLSNADEPGRIQLRAGALVEARLGPDGMMQIVVRRSNRNGIGGGPIAELVLADGRSVGVTDVVSVLVPAGREALALPIRGIITAGGVLNEDGVGSALLETASIIARNRPLGAEETHSFLAEAVGPGSLIHSHPELVPAPGVPAAAPAEGWPRWCQPGSNRNPHAAIGLLGLDYGEDDEPLTLSFIRHGPSVGLQTLGGAMPDDGSMVRLSVTTWAWLISSAWAQTLLVVMAGLLTTLNYFYQAERKNLLKGRPGK